MTRTSPSWIAQFMVVQILSTIFSAIVGKPIFIHFIRTDFALFASCNQPSFLPRTSQDSGSKSET